MFKETKTKKNEILLNFQSLKMKDVVSFLSKINELYSNGYILETEFSPKDCPKIPRALNLKFVENTNIELKKVDNIKSISSKDELLEYANNHGIDIPEDIVRFQAIKSYIVKTIESK